MAKKIKNSKSENGNNEKRKRAPLSTSRKVLYILLSLLFVTFAAVAGKYIYDVRHPSQIFNTVPVVVTPAVETEAVDNDGIVIATPIPTISDAERLLSEADLEFMQNRVNILLLGIDESTEREHWGSFRTDTIILVTINFETNDVNMISIPRDSYVKIANAGSTPTGTFDKINSAFSKGGGAQKNGYGYTMGTISYLLGGIPIHYYVGFNMNVVKDVVNAMDGVDFYVDVEVTMNGRELHVGYQHLDGQAVLDYCRMRKGSSDIERIDRQQRILEAIFKQLKHSGKIGQLPDIYRSVEQNIQTNLSFTQISSLAYLAYQMDLSQLQRATLPGSSIMVHKKSCIALSPTKIEAMIKEIYGINISVDPEITATSIRERIEENRQLIANELSAANNALYTANLLLSSYSEYFSSDEISQVKSAVSKLQDAYDEEEKELLDTYTPPVVQWNSYLSNKLYQAGINIQQPSQPAETPADGFTYG